jgi:integrase/recombinase XerC
MQNASVVLLKEFIDYLHGEKRAAALTVAAYQADLHILKEFCDAREIVRWGDVQVADIREFVAIRHKQGISAKSIQRELAAIRSFYRYLLKKQQIEVNPAVGVHAPKTAKKLPKVLDVDQVAGMLNVSANSILEIRDLAMFELFYSSGLRLNELVMLDITDLDLIDSSLRIRFGKGGKQRLVPVGSKAVKAIENWRKVRPESSSQSLFVSERGGRLSSRSVQLRLKRWCDKHGVAEHVHPHMLRHSFASHFLESSQDIRAVQEILGHADISTTQIYTHLDFQHLAKVYDAAHPRAKKVEIG